MGDVAPTDATPTNRHSFRGLSVMSGRHVFLTTHSRRESARGRRFAAVPVVAGVLALSTLLTAQDARRHFALNAVSGLRLHNVTATPATLQGKAGIKVAMSEEAQQQLQTKAPEEQQKLAMSGGTVEQL